MLAIIIGNSLIFLGFIVVVLPVLVTELSRPRDSVWGALIMILGLILFTSYERFNGSPMIAVVLGAFLCFRLFLEVSQNRWQQLTVEEKSNLKTFNHFKNRFLQMISAVGKLNLLISEIFNLFKSKPSSIGKKWIRPELRKETQSLESKQLGSSQAIIKNKDLVKDQILKSTSGNNTSDSA